MIYFSTNSDGNHTEGIGAMSQFQIVCYTLSKLYNVEYYFTGFKNLTHYQYFDITQEQWCKDITDFFNFPLSEVSDLPRVSFHQLDETLEEFINNNDNIIIDFEPSYLMSFIDTYIDNFEVQDILKGLKDNIILKDELKYFNKAKQNISIHIRKYTQTDCDLNPRREYFNKDKQHFYLELIKNLDTPNTEFHIYSQGEEEDFDFLKGNNIFLHIEENPLISLYHMINSNILITANSSLSYIAHLIGSHEKCYVRDTFFHKWKINTIKL
jgi:hypothetical protein